MTERLILAADIGATNARVLAESVASHALVHQAVYRNADYASLSEVLAGFMASPEVRAAGGDFASAALAVAGPTDGLHCRMTNLPWDIDARELAQQLGLPSVRLLNDVQAAAHGVGQLTSVQLARLQAGSGVPGAPRPAQARWQGARWGACQEARAPASAAPILGSGAPGTGLHNRRRR